MTSSAAAPTRASNLPYVQGLRAVAVLLVVAYHAGLPLPGGFIGVDVFFVISGFVICRMLATELRGTGSIRLGNFYIRRIRRLLPALAVVLVCVAIASSLIQSPIGAQQDTARTGLGASAWLSNAVLYLITGGYFDNAADSIPLLHTWSLSVEEQFYVLFPTLIALAWWAGRRLGVRPQRAVGATLGLVSASSFALSLYLSFGHGLPGVSNPASAAFYSMPTRAWEFGIGALLGLTLVRLDALPRWIGALAWPGAVLIVAGSVLIADAQHFPGWWALAPGLGTGAVIAGCYANGGSLTNLLSHRTMIALGDLSYSWYLWHFPFIVFSSTLGVGNAQSKVVAAVISLGVAFLSYRFVENPIRRRRPELRGSSALVVACVGIPVIAMLGLLAAANHGWYRASIREAQAQIDPDPIGYSQGCHSLTPLKQRTLSPCTFGPKDVSAPTIWLLGDSNAGQYADTLVASQAKLPGRRIVLATANGCPLIDVQVLHRGVPTNGCKSFVDSTVEYMATQPPGVVVVAAANEAVSSGDFAIQSPSTSSLATTVKSKEDAWRRGLERTIHELEVQGQRVVVVSTIPHFTSPSTDWWNVASCPLIKMWSSPAKCGVSESSTRAEGRQASALRAEWEAVAATGADYLNVRGTICPEGTCTTNRANTWIYRDGLHVTVREARLLAPQFISVLQQLS